MLWSLVIRHESIVGVNNCRTIALFIIFGGKGLLKKAIFCVLFLHLVFGKFLFLILNKSFLGKLFLRAAIMLLHFLLFSRLLLVEANVLIIQPSYSFSSFPDTFAATAILVILLVSAFTMLLSI